MTKLPTVKDAKALMTEAMNWSVFKWLWEKSNVRQAADDANAALDRLNRKTKAQWPEGLKTAYRDLAHDGKNKRNHHDNTTVSSPADPQTLQSLKTVKALDDKAHAARMDAEATFDEAERRMSTDLAREGCRKAIRSWELHEKAIRAAEALVPNVEESHSA